MIQLRKSQTVIEDRVKPDPSGSMIRNSLLQIKVWSQNRAYRLDRARIDRNELEYVFRYATGSTTSSS
jgi:hypothetical protein